jgi:hypothetical protein
MRRPRVVTVQIAFEGGDGAHDNPEPVADHAACRQSELLGRYQRPVDTEQVWHFVWVQPRAIVGDDPAVTFWVDDYLSAGICSVIDQLAQCQLADVARLASGLLRDCPRVEEQ